MEINAWHMRRAGIEQYHTAMVIEGESGVNFDWFRKIEVDGVRIDDAEGIMVSSGGYQVQGACEIRKGRTASGNEYQDLICDMIEYEED